MSLPTTTEVVKVSVLLGTGAGWGEGRGEEAPIRWTTNVTTASGATPNSVSVVVLERVSPGMDGWVEQNGDLQTV